MSRHLSRIVLVIGALVIAAMILFPPWHYLVILSSDNIDVPAGYSLTFKPPTPDKFNCPPCFPENGQLRAVSIKVDTDRLLMQIVGATIVSVLLAFALRKTATH
jgi:hypothetical protein